MTHHDMLKRMYYAQGDDTPKPVIALSLKDWTGYADTGQTLYQPVPDRPGIPEAATYLDKPCCKFPIATCWSCAYEFKPSSSTGHMAICGWVASPVALVKWRGTNLFFISNNSGGSGPNYGIMCYWPNNQAQLAGAAFYSATARLTQLIPFNTAWNHVAIVLDVEDSRWQGSPNYMTVYINGEYASRQLFTPYNYNISHFYIGNTRTSNDNIFYMRDVRAYNVALDAKQVKKVYKEGL